MKYSLQIIAITTILLTTNANASLIDRGSGLIFDTDLDITWLQDANYAFTSGHDDNGRMTWQQSMNWVSQIEYAGYLEWRLPTTVLPDSNCMISDGTYTGSYGYNCTESEMGHLFYDELMGEAGQSILVSGSTTELSMFNNLHADGYWSETVYDLNNSWDFKFSNGNQVWNHISNNEFYAMAVHDGDIGAVSTVPLPASFWLLGSGLIGLIGIAKRNEIK